MSDKVAVAKDSYEPEKQHLTSSVRGFRNTRVDVTPGLSWDERQNTERKAFGRERMLNTALKLPFAAELRVAVAKDSYEPEKQHLTSSVTGFSNEIAQTFPRTHLIDTLVS